MILTDIRKIGGTGTFIYFKVLGAVECKGFFGGGVYLGVVKKGKIGIPNFNLGGVFWRRLGRDTFKQTNIILNYQSSNFA